ncbi:bifunctional DNA primase/polymerase [Planosporangium mesophilum]|uniref:DNA primase/polymerase bifunctional N-terminal domain-containing protein n=1 Tax=Planosporangium mesophilum TaxID=689768 RepID=A0A8J3TGG0_9ACTN|nr:bifunctional DNA primase/polymerase [Planosporangium mesophilum]NJC86798.1 bifunctional DNA primase/polymerase [Planosporangium mesophilum]GII26498.1 hypothetical protein Pme01_60950 [Planosporangium mesophilum]
MNTVSKAALCRVALDAAARGWHVFPLRHNTKRPAFPNHDAEHCDGHDPRCRASGAHVGWEPRATTDPDRITRAWRITSFNVGIACGPSGLVVIDLDIPKPGQTPPPGYEGVTDGVAVFNALAAEAGHGFPHDTHAETYTTRTGRGGLHLYYQHPDIGPSLRNTNGEHGNGLGWLVDTRAHGGYVVAAGSVADSRPYTVAHDVDPAPLPGWLAERLAPKPLPAQVPVTVELGTDRRGAYLRAAIDRQLSHVTGAPAGQRNHALYASAVALGQLVAGGALTDADVTGLLTQAACSAGLRPAETARTIASGLRAGARRPRSVAA